MTTTQGTSGYFMAGAAGSAALVGEISRWTITETADPIETSVFGTRWKKFVNGPVGWTANLSGFYDCSDTAQASIEDALGAGTAIDIYAYVDATKYHYGSGFPTNVSIEHTFDGVATVSFQGSDELYDVCS